MLVKSVLENKARTEKAHNTGADKAVKDAEVDKKYKLEDFRMSALRDFEGTVNMMPNKIRMFKENVISPLRSKGVDVEGLKRDILKHVEELLNNSFRS